jgi:hypothetical protein
VAASFAVVAATVNCQCRAVAVAYLFTQHYRFLLLLLFLLTGQPEAVLLMRRQIPARDEYFSDDRALPALIALKPVPSASSQLRRAVPSGRRCLFPVSADRSSSSVPRHRRPLSPGLQVSSISLVFRSASTPLLVLPSTSKLESGNHAAAARHIIDTSCCFAF